MARFEPTFRFRNVPSFLSDRHADAENACEARGLMVSYLSCVLRSLHIDICRLCNVHAGEFA